MYWADHAPPHFHARYAGDEIVIDIRTLGAIGGSLPPRALALTLEWANLHREELPEDWRICAENQPPKKIRPLE